MKKFTFIWFIENYSYCWHDNKEELVSPTFLVEMIHNSTWNVGLYPKGDDNPNFISCYLNRHKECKGPDHIALNCEMSFLNSDCEAKASIEITEKEYNFKRGDGYGSSFFFEGHESDLRRNNIFFDTDILKICCTMWIGEGKVDKENFASARTRIGFEKISFISVTENFSTATPNEKKSFDVKSLSKDESKLSVQVYLKSENGSEEEVVMEISPDSKNVYLMTCLIYLIDEDGEELECGSVDTRNEKVRKRIFSVPLSLRKNDLLDKKLEYLPKGALTLRCECTLSTGIEFQKIEETMYDLQVTPFVKDESHDSNETDGIVEDLKHLYKDQVVSDIQLKTLDNTFPAHKSVLAARSPVFRAMLTTNMEEKLIDCIQIDDLDNDTIDKFLYFLYTDVLEDLQWEIALKLYYAADKYQVLRLKNLCSSFLMTKVDRYNISDLLLLADKHQDSSLKTDVENFICMNKKKIFCTREWETFMGTNPLLAMNTMHFYLKNNID